jgi:hypothetical protein
VVLAKEGLSEKKEVWLLLRVSDIIFKFFLLVVQVFIFDLLVKLAIC